MKETKPSPTAADAMQYRRATFTHRRGTTMFYFIVFGWGINFYPFWMFSNRIKPLCFKFHTPKEKNVLRDFSVTFLLGGLDVLPYRTA